MSRIAITAEELDLGEHLCETCEGVGTIDERLGGEHFSNPEAECPDCDGKGYWVKRTRPATSDDLARAEAERDLYRRIDLHQTHTAQSLASDILPPVPLFPLSHIGCSSACADTGECECSHKTAPRRPRQPRHRPSLWARIGAFLCQRRFK